MFLSDFLIVVIMSIDDIMDEKSSRNNIPIKIPDTLDGIVTDDEKDTIEKFKQVRLTKSQKLVLSIFESNYNTSDKKIKEGITPKELLDKLDLAPRTIRYAIRDLMKLKFIDRVPNMMDMRQWTYFLTDAYIYSNDELRRVDYRKRKFI
jgi:DNA-binding MarR family transcriptional regulator